MFCYKCGEKLDSNVKFCPKCGAKQMGASSKDIKRKKTDSRPSTGQKLDKSKSEKYAIAAGVIAIGVLLLFGVSNHWVLTAVGMGTAGIVKSL